VRLDVELAPGAGDGAATGRRDEPAGRPAAAATRTSSAAGTTDSTVNDDSLTTAPAVRLPAGSLVDVQA
jgi:hypothetical protein